MREIVLPAVNWDEVQGKDAIIPVKVNWYELQLTGQQIMANANARVNGKPEPFPDNSFFNVRVTRP